MQSPVNASKRKHLKPSWFVLMTMKKMRKLEYSRIRDSWGVSNDPVDGQVDQERHHTWKQHRHLDNDTTIQLTNKVWNTECEGGMCVCVLLSLTRAAVDQGPNIPPSPVTGSNRGTTQSRKPDDRGAWRTRVNVSHNITVYINITC